MKNIYIVALAIFATLVLVLSCTKNKVDTNNFKNGSRINSKEALALISENNYKDIILDVRTPSEFQDKRIKNSINIELGTLEKMAKVKLKDKNKRIYVYCRSGNRSTTATKILVNLGYTDVVNIGGINSWKGETE